MTRLWDVYLIYLHTTSTNFIPTGSEYVIENRFQKNRVAINVLARGKKSKQELLNVLAQACPNARFGYSDEGLAYLQYMRNQDLRNIPNTPYSMQYRSAVTLSAFCYTFYLYFIFLLHILITAANCPASAPVLPDNKVYSGYF